MLFKNSINSWLKKKKETWYNILELIRVSWIMKRNREVLTRWFSINCYRSFSIPRIFSFFFPPNKNANKNPITHNSIYQSSNLRAYQFFLDRIFGKIVKGGSEQSDNETTWPQLKRTSLKSQACAAPVDRNSAIALFNYTRNDTRLMGLCKIAN